MDRLTGKCRLKVAIMRIFLIFSLVVALGGCTELGFGRDHSTATATHDIGKNIHTIYLMSSDRFLDRSTLSKVVTSRFSNCGIEYNDRFIDVDYGNPSPTIKFFLGVSSKTNDNIDNNIEKTLKDIGESNASPILVVSEKTKGETLLGGQSGNTARRFVATLYDSNRKLLWKNDWWVKPSGFFVYPPSKIATNMGNEMVDFMIADGIVTGCSNQSK